MCWGRRNSPSLQTTLLFCVIRSLPARRRGRAVRARLASPGRTAGLRSRRAGRRAMPSGFSPAAPRAARQFVSARGPAPGRLQPRQLCLVGAGEFVAEQGAETFVRIARGAGEVLAIALPVAALAGEGAAPVGVDLAFEPVRVEVREQRFERRAHA